MHPLLLYHCLPLCVLLPLEEVDAEIPRSLSRIVQKCMQKKPDLRYENASALVLDLRRAVSDPDGDYVVLEEETDDSPTIMLGDDVVQAEIGRAHV